MKLFYAPGACSRACHIALEETGADYEPVRVDFSAGEQRKPPYLDINPKGRVPALVTTRGILTEAPAILAWIAQTHPEAGLAPTDPWEFARAQSFNSYLCATVHVNHAHRLRAARWMDDPAAQANAAAKVPETMAASMRLIEDTMIEGPFVLGAHFSICDAYLFTVAGWLKGDGVDIADYPRLAALCKAVRARPAVRVVLERERG